MKIYTRRGDGGETDLLGGPRVRKDTSRVEAYGAVDELNAFLGLCATRSEQADLVAITRGIQARLFDLGAYLASPDAARRARGGIAEPAQEDAAELERHIDALEKELAPLRRFILPGGSPAAAHFHAARTVCRRAERRLVELGGAEPVAAPALGYLNRLSDLLFVMARVENHRSGVADVEWVGRER